MSEQLVFAKIPFRYNIQRDRGEVFKLIGSKNDEKLIGLRYVLPFDPVVHKQIKCDMCTRTFIADGFYIGHKKKIDCNADQGEPTKNETAELLGVDVDKLKLEV
jgi:hypothetical protein